MKLRIKRILQRLFGLHRFLVIFAIFKVFALRFDQGDRDFLKFRELIPNTGIALDVGANIGVMTVLLARYMRHGQVIAFEPMPTNFRVLEAVTRLFALKNAILYPWALGDQEGTVTMVMPVVDDVRLHGIARVTSEDTDVAGDRATAPCKRLDDMAWHPQGDIPITSIKIDVEGHEYFMLQGAQTVISRYKPYVYCEISWNEYREDCLAYFQTRGYQTQIVVDGDLVAFEADKHDHLAYNFVFIPQSD